MSGRWRQAAAFVLCLAASYLTLATSCDGDSSTVLLDGRAQFAAGQDESSLRFEATSGGRAVDLAIRTEPDLVVEISAYEARYGGDAGTAPLLSEQGVLLVDCWEVNCLDLTFSVQRSDASAAREVRLEIEAVVHSHGCNGEPVGFVEMRLEPAVQSSPANAPELE